MRNNNSKGWEKGIEISSHCFWLVLIFMILFLSACSSKNTTVISRPANVPLPIAVENVEGFQWPDNNLLVRFQQYWTYRKSGDAIAAFEYEAPHIKEMVIWGKYERFAKTARADWLSIQVEKTNKITDQLIEIDFNMIAKNRDREGFTRSIFFRDAWLFFSGQWYHVLKDPFVTGDGIGK